MTYSLHFFCTDENGETVDIVREGIFATGLEALNCLNNIGSKWILYPHSFIQNEEGGIEMFLAD